MSDLKGILITFIAVKGFKKGLRLFFMIGHGRGKLEENGPQVLFKRLEKTKKPRKRGFRLIELFDMRDITADLGTEPEIFGYDTHPVLQGAGCGQPIEAGIDLGSRKKTGIVGKIFRRRQSVRIEDAFPVFVAPAGGANMDETFFQLFLWVQSIVVPSGDFAGSDGAAIRAVRNYPTFSKG